LENYQLIHKLDSYIIKEVCKIYRFNIDNKIEMIPVSFNLSKLDFILTDIEKVIDDLVTEYKVPHDMLNIEITESMFVENASLIGCTIDRFHSKGYKVWMDDFGSGYSSLNILKDYNFDELKIDMAFLSNFSEKSKKILKSIVLMAKEIGIKTLAEGVETKEEFEFLRDIGCEKIQGYYFGKQELFGSLWI
jgi:EAL domain-containing protein (putative c-di-GMP-specific phosphodiesterase class I)